jgi:tetratricopeptide (TPR) repeat protein
VLYGSALKDQEKYAQSEQALQRALNYDPYFANIYNNIGHLYDDWGRYPDAINAYHKTIQLMPRHHKAIYNLGIIYEKQGLQDSAKAAYHKAIATDGDFGKAYHNLAGIFNKQGQPDSARFYYEKALRAVHSTPESLFNLGNLFAQQKQFKAAIQAYEAFIANWEGDAKWLPEAQKGLSEAYSGLGVQKEQTGDISQALELYQTAIKHWPENAMNWYNLGNAYRLQDNTEQAILAYQKAIERDNTLTNAYNNLGLTYTSLKQYTKATETFIQSLKLHPENPATHINLANAYLGKGDIYRAIDSYEAFLDLWDRDDDTKKQVIEVLKELKASLP